MKKLLLLSFLFLVLSATVASAQAKFNVNFKNIPMKDFITFVSEFTGKNVIYNEADIKGNITINSQKEMNSKEILELFHSVLKINGYIAISKGDNIQIVADKDVPTLDEDVVDVGKGTAESYVTTIISMDNYNALMVLPILNRMKSRSGYIESVRGLNILVVRDLTSRIKKMNDMLKEIDKEADSFKFYTVPLNIVTASKVEIQINKLFGELGKSSIATTLPVVVSDDVSNTLIIAATDKDYARIRYLIDSLDKKSALNTSAPKIYRLKNAKAEDMEKILTKLTSAISAQTQGGTNQATGTTTRTGANNITADKSTNSINAIGDQAFYASLDSLIEKMDIARRQVYVEALILETTIDQGTQFGVEWFGGAPVANNQMAVLGGLSNSGALTGLAGAVTQGTTATLPGGFSLGVIGNIIQFGGLKFPSIGALVSALQSMSGVNIVSNPQILTLDNEEAEVFVGENRPYVTSEKYDINNNPIQTFDYRNVGIRLKITPQISNNDTVTLAINQEVNKISPATFNATAPVTLTRTTKTTVKLQDKSIMVISGLIKDDSSISRSQIPFLGKIPVLGWLFKTHNSTMEKTNMMVFITTNIIDTVDNDEMLQSRMDSLRSLDIKADEIFGDKIFSGRKFDVPLFKDIDNKTGGTTEAGK